MDYYVVHGGRVYHTQGVEGLQDCIEAIGADFAVDQDHLVFHEVTSGVHCDPDLLQKAGALADEGLVQLLKWSYSGLLIGVMTPEDYATEQEWRKRNGLV